LIALLLGLALAEEPVLHDVSDQTLVYYNARLALRDDHPLGAVKLWFVRNTLEDHTEVVSRHDADFRSVTWAALGEMGICQDGLPEDPVEAGGAGLWPLAVHNWILRNRGRRGKPRKPNPFDAFAVGRQARFVSIGAVVSAEELDSLRLFRTRCTRPLRALLDARELPTAELSDPQVATRVLDDLLERAQESLSDDVRGKSVLAARRFDIALQQMALAEREARRNERDQARKAREVGMSRPAITALREDAATTTLIWDDPPAQTLIQSADWSTDEWMALSPDRRIFLYDAAKTFLAERVERGARDEADSWDRTQGERAKTHLASLDAVAVGILDVLIERGDGAEAERWAARSDPEAVWRGERGARILALDEDAGFRERAPIALQRGVGHLERGDLAEAMRSFALAVRTAPESRDSQAVAGLSRRWLSYVASQFAITGSLLTTLEQLLPTRDYAVLLEDLMWGAAFRADADSFALGQAHPPGRGALLRRLALLDPLADGDVGRFARGVQEQLATSPSETMRVLEQFLDRLELEDRTVRSAQAITLTNLRDVVRPYTSEADGPGGLDRGRLVRTADEFMVRSQGLLEGVGALDPTDADRARQLDPDSTVFAGSVRLAPTDPLPWPFRAFPAGSPSVFEAIDLTPVEWWTTDADGHRTRVFGWQIEG
jgi:hypothetical protein